MYTITFFLFIYKYIYLCRSKYTYLRSIIRALNVLYGMTYDADIAKIIVSTSTLDMLKNIFELLNLDDENYRDYNKECSAYQVILL